MTGVMVDQIRSRLAGIVVVLACATGFACAVPQAASAGTVDDMTGCWISIDFDPTSLLEDSTKPDSATVVYEKMLLLFSRIEETNNLVFGRIYEWDKEPTYVLGPTYQNGVFDPIEKKLTFGFPEGGLDHVTQIDGDTLQYVHSKSSTKSAMAFRRLKRISCDEAKTKEQALRKRQLELKQ